VFRTAWATQATGTIDLSGDVTLGCTDGAGDGVAVRNQSMPIVVDGHGHSITQTCTTGTNNGVLAQNGAGAVTVQNVTITGGHAVNGGGVVDFGAGLTVTNSTISGNHATADAAGVLSVGSVTVTDSTISNNTTPSFGGGVDGDGSVTVTNSTISNNTAGGQGGGVNTANNGSVTLVYATEVQNTASTGANLATFNITSFGSVVAMAQGGTNCLASGVVTTSNGFNFSDDANATTSCKFNAATDRISSTNNPMLGALANNGGPTQTQLPQSGSPLIDAIPDPGGGCPAAPTITTDQRGVTRPQGPGCDIGAVEVQVATPASAAAPVLITPKFTG
jgi:hypothetical protein